MSLVKYRIMSATVLQKHVYFHSYLYIHTQAYKAYTQDRITITIIAIVVVFMHHAAWFQYEQAMAI